MSSRFLGALLLIAALGGAGCQSPSQYLSPRVTGRVVDQKSGEPLAGAMVWRKPKAHNPIDPPKGAQQLEQQRRVAAGPDGVFVVESEQGLVFFRRLRWYAITLSYAHPGYETLTQTYPMTSATNTPAGEPWIQAGDIQLKRRAP